jgi:predicted amidohydrolase
MPEIKLSCLDRKLFSLNYIFVFLPVFLSGFFMLTFNSRAVAMEKIKIAIAQTRCVDSDLEGNLGRIGEMAARADSAGAKMVFFPESADLGWVNPEAHRLADPVPGPFSVKIAELAKKHGIWIGIGLSEKEGDKLYDSAVIINPEGKIVLKHRKLNLLAWLMDPPYSPGDTSAIKAVDTPLGRLGMLICADSFEDNLLGILNREKPDLVYIPYGWAAPRENWPEHGFKLLQTVQRAARKIGAPVIGPNCVGEITHGPWKGQTYEGLSTAADARGMSLVQGLWNKEDLLVFEIEPGHVSR